jgi:hypothetical protein
VRAEPVGTSSANTVVGPMTNGPTLSQGTAGFDPSGTKATSSSTTNVAAPQQAQGPAGENNGPALTYVPAQNGVAPGGGTVVLLVSCPPGQTAYSVFDAAGALVSTACVGNQGPAPGGPLPSAQQLAQAASDTQPWPVLRVSTNPDIGLTGLASWFWCAGSASMPDATANSGPLTVTVRATLAGVDWNFGDGSRSAGGLGQPFPVQSDVQHVFQTSTFGLASGYTVTATVRWTVTFSVNGGPFTVLGVKSRSYSRSYIVNQLQPEAVGVT